MGAYIPTMLEKIKKIRKWGVDGGYDFDIEVDGGVKADWTIAQCADAGANCFIAGSGMFKYDDLSVGCSELRTIAEAAQKGKVLPEGQDLSWLGAKQVISLLHSRPLHGREVLGGLHTPGDLMRDCLQRR